MELLEAFFAMFGESIASSYFKWIENASPFPDKRKMLFKKIVSIAAAVIFIVAVVSVMAVISCEGIIRTVSLLLLLICALIVVLYVLLGFVLKRIDKESH